MKGLRILLVGVAAIAFATCSANLTSEGNSLDGIKAEGEAAQGQTHSITLTQINLEIDRDGLYLRAFDSSNNTIFLYFDAALRDKVGSLERNNEYIYKFEVTNAGIGTLSGRLLEVATADGKPVQAAPIPDDAARNVRLDGAAAVGQEYTVKLKMSGTGSDEHGDFIRFQGAEGYPFGFKCHYSDELAEQAEALEQGSEYTIKLRVNENAIDIDCEILNIE